MSAQNNIELILRIEDIISIRQIVHLQDKPYCFIYMKLQVANWSSGVYQKYSSNTKYALDKKFPFDGHKIDFRETMAYNYIKS